MEDIIKKNSENKILVDSYGKSAYEIEKILN